MPFEEHIKISIVPLSYKSSKLQISSFLDQISEFVEYCELIIILEKDDINSSIIWHEELKKRKLNNYILENLVNSSSKGACLNLAFQKSKGDYIMRCDMDDYIFSNRYQKTIECIKKNNPDFIYSDMLDIKTNKLLKYPKPNLAAFYSSFRNPFPAPTVCIRKSFFNKFRIQFPNINRCEDFFIAISFIDNQAKLFKLDYPIVKYNNNNINRDYLNWLSNCKIRFSRRRFDLIGIISILSGVLFLIIAFISFSFLKLKKLLIRFI